MAQRFSLRRRLRSERDILLQKLRDLGWKREGGNGGGRGKRRRSNPQGGIRAMVRRLPDGRVQIKIPLRRGNPQAGSIYSHVYKDKQAAIVDRGFLRKHGVVANAVKDYRGWNIVTNDIVRARQLLLLAGRYRFGIGRV
jgi:hypothetical protein